jgi:uncharacterized iron-regulated membrane protein
MGNDTYRAFWRWHFYAGLIVFPFLCWLAVTGSLYLFKPEIERAVYRDWIELGMPRQPMAVSTMIKSVGLQTHGTVTQIERPASASESWRMRVDVGDEARTAFVDPRSGLVLGTTSEGGLMQTVRNLHSLAITGPIGNALIEIAAGWAIVLVVTGFVLWWPRNGQPAIALRGPLRMRRFWRDFHASIGAIVGAVILFLAVTGMPWSVFWGAKVQTMVAANGFGRPKAPGPQPWEVGKHHHVAATAQRETLPWALQDAPRPGATGTGDIGPDEALRITASRGLSAPYTLMLPLEPSQPYSVSRVVQKARDAHAIYIEASSGKVLQDVDYAQFVKGAQLIEWGIATHQGQEYGPANRWGMLAGCIGILMLAISAPILWWKRRLNGSLKLPPQRQDMSRGKAATAVAVGLGIFYPLTGATVLLALIADRLLFGGARATAA